MPTKAMVFGLIGKIALMPKSGLHEASHARQLHAQRIDKLAHWQTNAMSGGDWIEAFLEMMAAERAAATNTLIAYGRDLADINSFL